MPRLPLLLAVVLSALAFASCGNGETPEGPAVQPAGTTRPVESATATGTAGAATGTDIAAARPVVYWVHTDW